MTPSYVTPDQIAQVAGVTEKHVRRMISRAQGGGPFGNPLWFGTRMRVSVGECGPEVEFATLPGHIREGFVMQDQEELPLPPPRNTLNLNEPSRPALH
jgi:hypothetical protein